MRLPRGQCGVLWACATTTIDPGRTIRKRTARLEEILRGQGLEPVSVCC